MTHDRSAHSRSRTFLLPLVVALPVFFVLFSLMEGWLVVTLVEQSWQGGEGNVWQALLKARRWVWGFAAVGAICGFAWGWVILLPAKRYKAQLDRLAQEGAKAGKIELEDHSELSFLADSFNRVMEEMGRNLPTRIQAILASITSGVILIDPKGVVERVNPSAARFLQANAARLEGRCFKEVLGRSEELVPLVERALQTQSDYPQDTVSITDKYGDSRPLGVWLAWVRDSEANPVSLVLTLMDHGRLESFSSALQGAERLSLLGKIARGIGHEIRNPLSSIRGLAQLIVGTRGLPPEKLNSYARVMVEEADRVERVLNRLSILAAPHNERSEPTPIRSLFESVREVAEQFAVTKSVDLEIRVDESDPRVYGHPKLLTNAILNVVINALEASPEEGKVVLSASSGPDGTVTLCVENNGPAIPPGELDDIFQPFHTTKPNAAGLGLTITESIVQDHGGRISVRSGNDSTGFTIVLPVSSPMVGLTEAVGGAVPAHPLVGGRLQAAK